MPAFQRLIRRAVAALALLGCGLGPAPAAAQVLQIAVSRTPLSLPLFVAEAQGYYAAEGLQVTSRECIGGQRCLKLLLDGEVPLATVSDLPIMFNSFERSDYAILATFVTTSRDVKLITRKSSGIATPAQLQGRRIGTVKGAAAHYFLDGYLLFNGIDPKKIELVGLPPEQLPGALERREVDAVAVWEPFAFGALKALGADALHLPAPRIYTETFNLVGNRDMAATREADLVKLLRALERAQRYIREQPREAQAILKSRLQLEQDFIDWAWRDLDYRLGLDQSLLSTLEGEARWAQREGHVGADRKLPNYLQFVNPGPLRQVVPAAVTTAK